MEEYLQAFALTPGELKGRRVLDCPAGPSSFISQANALGCQAFGADLLYDQSAAALEAKGRCDIEDCLTQIRAKPHSFPGVDFETYAANKRIAFERFIVDYQKHRNRYLHGCLPNLPIANRSFDLVISGHFMFVYSPVDEDGLLDSGGFDLQWHHQAARELARVSSREIRIYPTQACNAATPRRHRFVPPIVAGLTAEGWQVSFEPSEYRQLGKAMNDCLVARRLV